LCRGVSFLALRFTKPLRLTQRLFVFFLASLLSATPSLLFVGDECPIFRWPKAISSGLSFVK
jgi:hypothetical protein